MLDLGLGDEQLQNAVLILGLHILRLHILAHIEAAAEGTGVTLLADITALLILLVLVQSLGGADGQATVLQLDLYLVLLKTGQVHVDLVTVLDLPHIGVHQVLRMLAVQLMFGLREHCAIKEIIKQVLTKNTG